MNQAGIGLRASIIKGGVLIVGRRLDLAVYKVLWYRAQVSLLRIHEFISLIHIHIDWHSRTTLMLVALLIDIQGIVRLVPLV